MLEKRLKATQLPYMVSASQGHETPLSETPHSTPRRFQYLDFCLEAGNLKWPEEIVLETIEHQRSFLIPGTARCYRTASMLDEPSVLLTATFNVVNHSPDSLATMKDSGVRWGRGGGASSSSGCAKGAGWRNMDRLLARQDTRGTTDLCRGGDCSCPATHQRLRVQHL